MKRALAVLAAIGMIGGALYIRNRDDGGGASGPTTTTEIQTVTLACVTELEDVCQALAAANPDVRIQVEGAATTEATLAAAGHDYDAWLTLVPWTQIVNTAAGVRVIDDPGAPLAQARVGFVIFRDREDALVKPGGRCPGGVDWRCLGNVAGESWEAVGGDPSWGKVKVAHAPPSTAAGELELGALAANYFGKPTFASNDFDSDFKGWMARLEGEAGEPSPLDKLLQQGPAAYAAVAATEAEITAKVLTSRLGDSLDVVYPDPVATAYVVLAPVPGAAGADRLADVVASAEAQAAFTRAGWQPAPGSPVPSSGLPNEGVLIALRSLWEEIVG